MSQEELAERARLSARAISDLERGVKRTPRRDTVQLLVEALELKGEARTAFVTAAREPAARRIPRPASQSQRAVEDMPPYPHVTAPPTGGFLGAVPESPLIGREAELSEIDRKSTRLNSSHANISYAVFCLKKKNIISSSVTLSSGKSTSATPTHFS